MPGLERDTTTTPGPSVHNIGGARFTSSGFAVLRTPAYPLSEFLDLASGLEAPACPEAGDGLEQAYGRDRARLRQRLAEISQRPEFREAVFLASPSLEERISVWSERPASDEGQRIERALYKYFVRMSGRPTPFGTFAGCSHCRIGSITDLQAPEPTRSKRRSRLDMNYVSELALNIEKDARFKQALRYYPNGSLYSAAGRPRYIEYRLEDNHRVHHLVAVDASAYLDLVLAKARAGCPPRDLLSAA